VGGPMLLGQEGQNGQPCGWAAAERPVIVGRVETLIERISVMTPVLRGRLQMGILAVAALAWWHPAAQAAGHQQVDPAEVGRPPGATLPDSGAAVGPRRPPPGSHCGFGAHGENGASVTGSGVSGRRGQDGRDGRPGVVDGRHTGPAHGSAECRAAAQRARHRADAAWARARRPGER
jgi:hypothetical protein